MSTVPRHDARRTSTSTKTLLTDNPIFKERTERHRRAHGRGRARPGRERARRCAPRRRPRPPQGEPVLRLRDVRLRRIPTGTVGDCYDRYLVRVAEMRESVKICRQALERLPDGPVQTSDRKVMPPPREELGTAWRRSSTTSSCGPRASGRRPARRTSPIESPRGELGFYIVSDGSGRPYRVHERAPSFANLQALPHDGRGRRWWPTSSRASPAWTRSWARSTADGGCSDAARTRRSARLAEHATPSGARRCCRR